MGGLQNRDMALRLARGGAELNRHLQNEFTRAATLAAARTQAKILGASTRHPGALRAQIAATVSARARTGTYGVQAEIRSAGSRMPAGEKNLPAYANAGQARWRRWRHPVYQTARNPDTWVTQDWPSAHGWFDDTIRAAAPSFTAAAETAIRQTSAYLEGRT
jgi:hypothetical protein